MYMYAEITIGCTYGGARTSLAFMLERRQFVTKFTQTDMMATVTIRTCDDTSGSYVIHDLYLKLKQTISKLQRGLIAVSTSKEIHVYDLHTRYLLDTVPFYEHTTNCVSSVTFLNKDVIVFASRDTLFVYNLLLRQITAQVDSVIPSSCVKSIQNNLIYHGGSQ
jgi:hypothetical protein